MFNGQTIEAGSVVCSPRLHEERVTPPRALIALALNSGKPREIVEALKILPPVSASFPLQAVCFEKTTIGEHTERVLEGYHPFQNALAGRAPQCFGNNRIRLLLGVHDVCKRIPDDEGFVLDKGIQHTRTTSFIRDHAHHLPFSVQQREIAIALIESDIFGGLFKSIFPCFPRGEAKLQLLERLKSTDNWGSVYREQVAQWEAFVASYKREDVVEREVTRAVGVVRDCASHLGILPREFLYLATIFPQVDAMAYTWLLRSTPSLEYILALYDQDPVRFEFSHDYGRMLFSPPYEEVYRRFEIAVSA